MSEFDKIHVRTGDRLIDEVCSKVFVFSHWNRARPSLAAVHQVKRDGISTQREQKFIDFRFLKRA